MDYYEPRDDWDTPPYSPPNEPTPIQKVFEDAVIFMTGATGFMGKVLLEKLLRSCNVSKIYVLVREKKGIKPEGRMATIFEDKIFDSLKLHMPDKLSKMFFVAGDCTLPDLGISEKDQEKLANVNIIYHAAATLYMDQHLKVAFITNVLATKFLLEFSKSLPRLQAFMYISTAYTHAYRDLLEERFYDVQFSEEEFRQVCNNLDDIQIGALTTKLTGRWRNTYALTKACAENVISKYDGILPIGVIRPSIVVSTWNEPIAGWTDNINGPTGIVLGSALGVLQVFRSDKDKKCDLIPVDTAINITLAATSEVILKNNKIKIYNCVSSMSNPFYWKVPIQPNFMLEASHYFSTKAAAAPNVHLVKNSIVFYLYSIWFHVIPAFFFDLLLQRIGKYPKLMKVYIKVYNVNKLLFPYCGEREIEFNSVNTSQLWKELSSTDKTLFNFDLKPLSWHYFWVQALKGMRVYLIKEPMDTIPEGHKKRFRLLVRKYIFDALVWMVLIYLLFLLFL